MHLPTEPKPCPSVESTVVGQKHPTLAARKRLLSAVTFSFHGGHMKTKTMVLTLALSFAAAAVCLASPQMGTWKLNEAKSKLNPAGSKNVTVVYVAAGDNVKVIVDGTDKDGKPTHNEWVGKFDGKDYPVTGDPTSDMRAYKTVDANTLDLTVKKGGNVTATGRIVVAADGKSRTVTTSGTDSAGKKVEIMSWYDKQ
jgi:hypothetical protein